ncbi:AraC family transcriptional regulator [Aequorivita antarctica]|uniref:Helix-turn-helix domain-containing protein n=1 Tax=Aequorivita antarctica TaxID=153266 RepID=A0A5C6Z233_9FLAO|nr:helix-turn-helix domain-containing protein [Aequorivita antarctica]TXD73563.1 helix-turn-helix domain-containing protein [Aequorivita antarctica]SRX76479.1 Regulatory protein PchR [Aequorivita antarctica]
MSQSKKKRLKQIRNMLLEIGSGNFFYRVERSVKNDNMEALVMAINMMSEEIEAAMVHQGYANANETIKHIVIMSFILDFKGYVEMVNQQTCIILSYLCEDIIGQPLESFLDEISSKKWRKSLKTLQRKEFYDTSEELTFKTKEGLLVPSACYITTYMEHKGAKGKTLLTVVKHSKNNVEAESDPKQSFVQFKNSSEESLYQSSQHPTKQKVRLSYEDISKIREARDILINNLEKDFPSIKDFALQIGTNTFKLKYGFKELYGISVYRFLKNERLRKAKMLVQYGDRSFKSIAHMTGFKSVPHFTRTFKKQFGYTPTELRKRSSKDDK